MRTKELFETSVNLGDLVFIVNTKHPTKSGWWRKLKINSTKSETYYVLEKSIHKDFDTEDTSLQITHKIDGYFVMKPNTIRTNKNKYLLLVDVGGIQNIELVKNEYDFDLIDLKSDDVVYTKEFEDFMKYYQASKEESKYKSILEDLAHKTI